MVIKLIDGKLIKEVEVDAEEFKRERDSIVNNIASDEQRLKDIDEALKLLE